jgi:hypothetical protein
MDQRLVKIVPRLVSDEPRIFDMVLGERLGYARPDYIRRLIVSYQDELEAISSLIKADPDDITAFQDGTRTPFVPSRGNRAPGFWLNKAQAILVSVVSDAPNAPAVRR